MYFPRKFINYKHRYLGYVHRLIPHLLFLFLIYVERGERYQAYHRDFLGARYLSAKILGVAKMFWGYQKYFSGHE